MKKIIVFATLSLMMGISCNVYGQQNTGGYTGPSDAKQLTVADAVKQADNTTVELTGKIEKALGDEKYSFSDASGKVTIEIDNEDFRGVSVNENDAVRIKGEVDKELLEETTIDVESVEKVQ